MVDLTDIQARVISLIQAGFPIERNPYEAIGRSCGIDETEAFQCVNDMREAGDIRRLGAIFDSAKLGYVSTLCALAVEDTDDIETAAAKVSSYDEVTHNYLRADRYNIWFTIIAQSQRRIDQILADIAYETGYDDILDLPASRLFKIRVDFNVAEGRSNSSSQVSHAGALGNPRDIARSAQAYSEKERILVRILQEDVSGCLHPFDEAAQKLSDQGFATTPDQVVETVSSWVDAGVIRRFGAVVRHRKLGFAANAMTVWDIPDEDADEAGVIMAEDPRVSHCYCRARRPSWHANEYAMIHGKTEEECRSCAEDLRVRLEAAGIPTGNPRLLFSSREFKKRSMRYFCEEER